MMTSRLAPRSLIGILSTLVVSACSTSEADPPQVDAAVGELADASEAMDAAGNIDAAPDATPAAMEEGLSGETCAASCAAAGKTCTPSCQDHRSCGSHDGVPPPYAGYACYFWENEEGTFRVNDGRSFTSCDEVVTETWNNFGTEETLGHPLGQNPVTCCCQ